MQRRRSPVRRVFLLVATVLALLVAPAAASANCGDSIIDEVFNTGSVQGAYALRCYDLAVARLNGDAAEYSEARGIISAAKIVRRNQLANAAPTTTSEQTRDPQAETSTDGGGGAGPTESGGAAPSDGATAASEPDSTDEVTSTDPSTDDASTSEGDTSTDAAAPASFDSGGGGGGTPLPVFLLGGAAVVLLGVGAGGMVYRRMQNG